MYQAFIPVDGFAITPDDDNDLAQHAYSIRADVGGTIHYTTSKGQVFTETFADGETLIMVVRKVFETGTTATGLRGNLIGH